jgi:hypothetical protein
LDPYSKCPEAAALLAGLTWIQKLLRKFPNQTETNPPPLLIPVDKDGGVVKDVHRTINAQTPTYDLLSPNFDILQAIRTTKRKELPIRMDIAHGKGHQDRHKLWHELDIHEKINVLADRQANAIYKTPLWLTGLFLPTWIPGTRAALFHGERQVTKGIPAYIRDASHMPALKEYLIRCSKEATGRDKSWMKPCTIPLTLAPPWRSIQTTIERTAHPDFQVHQRPTPNQTTPSNF